MAAARGIYAGFTAVSALARELAVATVVTIAAIVVAAIAERALDFRDLSLVFITAVLVVAVRTRMAVAVYTAFATFLAYNFFFIEPRYTLYIQARQGVATVVLFLAAALVCGRLANRLRAQLIELRAAAEQREALHLRAETEKLRAALLTSVSHDLRTPLSTIIGAAESLGAYGDRLPPEDRDALAHEILCEGQRLDRYVQNLLDMTRLGQGPMAPAREWIGLDELVGAAFARIRRAHPSTRLESRLPDPTPPLVHVHPGLMEQALFNVLDNAAKAAPAGSAVTLAAEAIGDRLAIEVRDAGPGIPLEERERVFEMFHSAGRSAGTGLGLTISRGIVQAHGGTAVALAGTGGVGCTIRIELPLPAQPADRTGED
jgi:K+-sensing histidine kinase KdpD